MSFVVIVEPEEANAERIRAILEGADKNFEYELLNYPEKAIDIVEHKQVDVLISNMEMPVMTGTELFSLIEMISPDTIRVAMTDAKKITETVAFMNECRTFKLIFKPCKVADDLISPINASIEYKEMKQRIRHDEENANMGIFSTEQDFRKMKESSQKNQIYFQSAQHIFTQMLKHNLDFGNLDDQTSGVMKDWYEWLMEEFIRNITKGPGVYEDCVAELKNAYHKPEHDGTFLIKKISKERISQDKMNEIAFLLHLMSKMCQRLLLRYRISIVIESIPRAYILRFGCAWYKKGEKEGEIPYRQADEKIRTALLRATEACVAAYGYQSVTLRKEGEVIINIALKR